MPSSPYLPWRHLACPPHHTPLVASSHALLTIPPLARPLPGSSPMLRSASRTRGHGRRPSVDTRSPLDGLPGPTPPPMARRHPDAVSPSSNSSPPLVTWRASRPALHASGLPMLSRPSPTPRRQTSFRARSSERRRARASASPRHCASLNRRQTATRHSQSRTSLRVSWPPSAPTMPYTPPRQRAASSRPTSPPQSTGVGWCTLRRARSPRRLLFVPRSSRTHAPSCRCPPHYAQSRVWTFKPKSYPPSSRTASSHAMPA